MVTLLLRVSDRRGESQLCPAAVFVAVGVRWGIALYLDGSKNLGPESSLMRPSWLAEALAKEKAPEEAPSAEAEPAKTKRRVDVVVPGVPSLKLAHQDVEVSVLYKGVQKTFTYQIPYLTLHKDFVFSKGIVLPRERIPSMMKRNLRTRRRCR